MSIAVVFAVCVTISLVVIAAFYKYKPGSLSTLDVDLQWLRGLRAKMRTHRPPYNGISSSSTRNKRRRSNNRSRSSLNVQRPRIKSKSNVDLQDKDPSQTQLRQDLPPLSDILFDSSNSPNTEEISSKEDDFASDEYHVQLIQKIKMSELEGDHITIRDRKKPKNI